MVAFARQNRAAYKGPQRIEFREHLPTPSGNVIRGQLQGSLT